MATWPSTLKVERSNYNENPPDRVMRSGMDVGPQKLRRRTSSAVRTVSFNLFLTQALLDTLDAFYLANDAIVFNFTNPRTGVVERARFTQSPSYALQETYFEVSVKLEYLP